MKCTYIILPELNLIVEYFAGQIDPDCVIASKERMLNDPQFDKAYNLLDDFRDAILEYSIEGIKDIITWIAKNHNFPRQSAHLTTSPDQVVATTLFDRLKSIDLSINLKIFSTIDKAVKWVQLTEDEIPIIEAAIEELKRA